MPNKTFTERMRAHLRSQVDGEMAIQQIGYLTFCLATGFESKFNVEVALDDLRTKQIALALTSYHRTLTRVMPDLKAIDLLEELDRGTAGGKDWSEVDRLEVANRIRHLLRNATAFKQPLQLEADDDFWD